MEKVVHDVGKETSETSERFRSNRALRNKYTTDYVPSVVFVFLRSIGAVAY